MDRELDKLRNIRIEDYTYNLPDERIAKFPLAEREASKLLIYRGGRIEESRFSEVRRLLRAGQMLVFNNTKVIHARLFFRKATGAVIEVFCLEPYLPVDYAQNFAARDSCEWSCMVGNLKKWKEGSIACDFTYGEATYRLTAEKVRQQEGELIIRFSWTGGLSFSEVLEGCGRIPIPPYLNRETQESDKETYQTVYSKIKGSVAAPTAGLHFTPRVLDALREKGVALEELTLHVGAGTFKPVKSEEIEGHEMHTEYISVNRSTLEKLVAHEGKAIAVGTTSVRTLESLYHIGVTLLHNPNATEEDLHVKQWQPYETALETAATPAVDALQAIIAYLDRHHMETLHSSTQIIIAPGYEYRIVKAMVTNFHQPQSTLLLLVSAFLHGDWRKIYDYALAHDFRFLSYGDSSLLIP